jgi:site-specific DNA recombinase
VLFRSTQLKKSQVTKAEVDSALEAFTPLWETLSPKEQAAILHLLIQRVDYDGAKGKVAITFHPHGLRALGQGNPVDLETNECTAA